MYGGPIFTAVRIVGYVVLAAMITALLYAGWISVTHWSGIGV